MSNPSAVFSTSGPGVLWLRGVGPVQGLTIHPIGITPGTDQTGWPLTPLSFWQAWNWEPALLLGLAGLALLYAYGVR